MNRIKLYEGTGHYKQRVGWFDLDAATLILVEDQKWDGNNWLGTVSGLQTSRAELYRTKGGRWVSHEDATREYDGDDSWASLTGEEAREWMIQCGDSDAEKALAQWFPDTPDESEPDPRGGRPAIGPAINVAYPEELLERVDAAAKADKVSRAEWLRRAAEKALP
ncbi:CopG family transcriptional regulator [Streptomyces sp. KL116D]|uniref:ribbon-helix-helix domain-containing protein n=1 Tax=Streptomyces sp. KL116D TaxID=3045152 RepID=UPI003556B300